MRVVEELSTVDGAVGWVAGVGGYRLSGRWSFASAGPHAAWFIAGCQLDGDVGDAPVDGMPASLVPARDLTIVDTWSVGGTGGTGSHDLTVHDLFVPTEYAADPITHAPRHQGALYRVPFRLTLGAGLGPLALGMARRVVDCFTELMVGK